MYQHTRKILQQTQHRQRHLIHTSWHWPHRRRGNLATGIALLLSGTMELVPVQRKAQNKFFFCLFWVDLVSIKIPLVSPFFSPVGTCCVCSSVKMWLRVDCLAHLSLTLCWGHTHCRYDTLCLDNMCCMSVKMGECVYIKLFVSFFG